MDTEALLGFALLLVRCTGTVMLLPGWAETEVPAIVRASVALALAVFLWPAMESRLSVGNDDGATLLALIADELLAGVSLGFMARVVVLALPMAGQIVSLMIGLTSVLQMDAAVGVQSTALSRFFGLAAPLLLLGSGLYELPLRALAGSYAVWPPGQAPFGGVEAMVNAVSAGFGLALQLAAPLVLASVVFQISIGLLSRLVPQVQVYLVAVPGQLLGGLVLLMAFSSMMLRAWGEGVAVTLQALPGL